MNRFKMSILSNQLIQMNRFKRVDYFNRVEPDQPTQKSILLSELTQRFDPVKIIAFLITILCFVAGQGWVGWRNDTRNGQPLEIKFEFDQVREFTAVHLYCNNQFLKDVQVSKLFILIYSTELIQYFMS